MSDFSINGVNINFNSENINNDNNYSVKEKTVEPKINLPVSGEDNIIAVDLPDDNSDFIVGDKIAKNPKITDEQKETLQNYMENFIEQHIGSDNLEITKSKNVKDEDGKTKYKLFKVCDENGAETTFAITYDENGNPNGITIEGGDEYITFNYLEDGRIKIQPHKGNYNPIAGVGIECSVYIPPIFIEEDGTIDGFEIIEMDPDLSKSKSDVTLDPALTIKDVLPLPWIDKDGPPILRKLPWIDKDGPPILRKLPWWHLNTETTINEVLYENKK